MKNQVIIRRASPQLLRGDDWDTFAQLCNYTSYQCSRDYIILRRVLYRLHLFEFFSDERKIGQCAVGEPRFGGKRVFFDAIQLDSQHQSQWAAVMCGVLAELGAATYQYGSVWSLEPHREDDLQKINTITLLNSDAYRVMAVDFSAWPDWSSYQRAMSTNTKRNAAKAKKTDPDIKVIWVTGRPSISEIVRLLLMRHNLLKRKGARLGSGVVQISLEIINKTLLLRRYCVLGRVIFGGRRSAYTLGLLYGDRFFYTDGGSIKDNGGSAWYLLTDALRLAKEKFPTGKFVMGHDPVEPSNLVGWDNVLRQRHQCKVSNYLTSVVTFSVS